MIIRTITCACGNQCKEEDENAGFEGWGQLSGVMINEHSNPHLCPNCLSILAEMLDRRGATK